MRGEPYQFFLNTPWGDQAFKKSLLDFFSAGASLPRGPENQYAKNYTSFSSRFSFNGKEWDEETGNYYYGARYYDPKVSVWLSVDELAHKYPSLSPYAYVGNNPVNAIDPDGRRIVLVSKNYSGQNVEAGITSVFKAAFGDKVNVSFNREADYGYNNTLQISLADGAELTKSEMAIYNSIKAMTTSDDRIEVTTVDGNGNQGSMDSYIEEALYPDNFEKGPEGTEGVTKLTGLDHFFDEQYSKQVLNKGENNYTADHKYALDQGKEKFGYTWGLNYAPKGADYSKADVYNAKGDYMHTVKVQQTDNGPEFSTFVK